MGGREGERKDGKRESIMTGTERIFKDQEGKRRTASGAQANGSEQIRGAAAGVQKERGRYSKKDEQEQVNLKPPPLADSCSGSFRSEIPPRPPPHENEN